MNNEGYRDSGLALTMVVGALVGLICFCIVAAVSLAIVHFKQEVANSKVHIRCNI